MGDHPRVSSLGPYQLLERLGAGGMGEVWKAQRVSVGGVSKNFALKTLLKGRSGDDKMRRMFLDEARLSMLLSNSNIVQVFDVGETEDGTCYMAMEWVRGVDLAELSVQLRAKPELLEPQLSAYIIGEVLKALAYAHEFEVDGEVKTLIHRDISPHNVMLSVRGEVKLMDFGVARLVSEDTSGVHVKGKVRYMSPEQIGGESKEPRSDLFAVGTLLHELLSGNKFRSEYTNEGPLYGAVINGKYASLEDCDAPKELRELAEALLAADPEDRPPSAREAFKLLAAWPGYRDSKFELETVVRAHAPKHSGPRTSSYSVATNPGTGSEISGSETELAASANTRTDTGISEGPKPPPQARGSELSGSKTEIAPPLRLDSGETELMKAPPPSSSKASEAPAPERKTQPWAVGLIVMGCLVAVGTGVLSIGVVLGWWGEREPEVVVVEASSAAASPEASANQTNSEQLAVAESEAAAAAGSETETGETETGGSETETGEATETGEGGETETGEEPVEEQPVKAAPVAVTLSAPGKPWIQFRIDKREFELDRLERKVITTKLQPGPHEFSYRESTAGSWKSAGTVKIPRRRSVKLTFQGGAISISS